MALIERFTPGGNLYPDGNSTFPAIVPSFRRMSENRDKVDKALRGEWQQADASTLVQAKTHADTRATTAEDNAKAHAAIVALSALSDAKAYTDVSFQASGPGGATDAQVDAAVDRGILGGRLAPAAKMPSGGKQAVGKGELSIRPEDYGAVGDGTTNDRSAILAAAEAAAPFGATLLMAAAKYYIGTGSLTFPAGSRVRGSSTIEGGSGGAAAFGAHGNSVFEGITFRNSGTGYRFAVNVQPGANNVQFIRCKFPFTDGVGVYINSAGISNVTVHQCVFDGQAYGVLSNSGMNSQPLSGAHDLKNVTVTNSVFTNISAEAIEFNHPYEAGANGVRGTAQGFFASKNIMQVNQGSGQTAGFAIGAAGISKYSFTENIVLEARYEGFHIEDDCKDGIIRGNHVANITGDDAYAAISILPSCTNVIVSGNTVENVTGPRVVGGIVVGYASVPVHSTNIKVYNNIVTNVQGEGIRIAADSGGNFQVRGNTIRDVTSHGVAVLGGVRDGYEVQFNTIINPGGYGVYVGGPLTSVRPNTISPNDIRGAALGDYNGFTIANGISPVLFARSSYTDAGPASIDSNAELPLFKVGRFAQGTVRVSSHSRSNSANRAIAVYNIRWDGTTLTYSRIHGSSNGTYTAGTLLVRNGMLTMSVFVGTTGISLRGSCEFVGVSYDDGVARTGVVTGVIPSLRAAATDAASAQSLVNDLRAALIAWGMAT